MFRKLFFGLGVLLGVVSPQTAPDLSARVYRIGDQLYVNIELVGAYAGTALDLVSSGTRVAIGLEAAVEGSSWPPVRVTRSIRRDGAVDAWIVETETKGEEKILRDRDAALILASRAWGIHLGPADGSRRGNGEGGCRTDRRRGPLASGRHTLGLCRTGAAFRFFRPGGGSLLI